jgi:hypothetical protein
MLGTCLINERISLDGLTREESVQIQKDGIQRYFQTQKIKPLVLNRNQLHDFYTIPHALLYDLKMHKVQLECLVIYSHQVIEDFIFSYPARWLILKSYFKEIIFLEDLEALQNKKIV